MKKALSLVLALVMALSLSVCAFAGTVTTNGGEDKGDVKVTVKDLVSSGTVYYVVVEWDTLTFTYNKGTQGAWNPETHTYGTTTLEGWVTGTDELDNVTAVANEITSSIKVTNHSNANVWSTATYAANGSSAISGVTVSLGETAGTPALIAAGLENKPAEASYNTYTVTVGGTPDTVGNNVTVGTITVTIYNTSEP